MTIGFAKLIAPVLILAAGIGGFWVFGQRPEQQKREQDNDSAVLVETTIANEFVGSFNIEVEGVATPFRQITLSAEVAGRISRKEPSCKAGGYVVENEPLYEIDDTDYLLEIERLESQLKQSQADVDLADVDIASAQSLMKLANEEHDIRQKDLARQTSLFKRGAISQNILDDVRLLELTTRNSLQTLTNQIAAHRQKKESLKAVHDLAKVQLKRAKVDLERTRVKSSITGTVIKDYVEENDYVKKGDPLIVLNETSRMEIKCDLRIEELYWVWMQSGIFKQGSTADAKSRFQIPPTKVEIAYSFDGTEYLWEGVLSRYEGTGLDQTTRTVPCRVLVSEPTKVRVGKSAKAHSVFSLPTMFTGMYCTIRIPVDPPVTLLEVSSTAIRPGGKIWAIRDGKLHIENVHVAHTRREQETVLIRQSAEEIRAGEKVVTSPLSRVQTGMLIREKGLE